MIKQLLILSAIFVCLHHAFSQKVPKSAISRMNLTMRPYGSPLEKAELFYVNLDAYTGNGVKRYIHTDKKDRTISWDKFNIEVRGCGAVFEQGKLKILRNKVNASMHEITFRVSPKNNPTYVHEQGLAVPYIDTMYIRENPGRAHAPGDCVDLMFLKVRYSSGKEIPFSQIASGDQANVFFESGSYHELGKFCMPGIEDITSEAAFVRASLKGRVDFSVAFSVPYDFQRSESVDVSGEKGYDGYAGNNGSTVSEKQRGEDGANGGYGGNGSNGQDVEVYLKTIAINDTFFLIKATVNVRGKVVKTVYYDPRYAQLNVISRGGNGGHGGYGGSGSNGGDSQNPDFVGNGGNGGNGGRGGDGGNGGRVRLYVMKGEQHIALSVNVQNEGGDPGEGGRRGRKGLAGVSPGTKAWEIVLGAYSGSNGMEGDDGRRGQDGGPREIIVVGGELNDRNVSLFQDWY